MFGFVRLVTPGKIGYLRIPAKEARIWSSSIYRVLCSVTLASSAGNAGKRGRRPSGKVIVRKWVTYSPYPVKKEITFFFLFLHKQVNSFWFRSFAQLLEFLSTRQFIRHALEARASRCGPKHPNSKTRKRRLVCLLWMIEFEVQLTYWLMSLPLRQAGMHFFSSSKSIWAVHLGYTDSSLVRPSWTRFVQALPLGMVKRALSTTTNSFCTGRPRYWTFGVVLVSPSLESMLDQAVNGEREWSAELMNDSLQFRLTETRHYVRVKLASQHFSKHPQVICRRNDWIFLLDGRSPTEL